MRLHDIRGEDGKLPTYAWPGGYPILYLDSENFVLCPECANDEGEHNNPIVAQFIHWEGPSEWCEDCSAEIESAYGDPEGD